MRDDFTEHNTRPGAVFPPPGFPPGSGPGPGHAFRRGPGPIQVFLPGPRPRRGDYADAVAWTRWDGRQLVRAALVAALAVALAWLVTAATDEGGVAWRERAGRTLPLTPLCAAVGAWVSLAPVRSRGEALALEALGRSPAQIALAAVLGGALVALVAAVLLGAGGRAVDVEGFFPAATHGGTWLWDAAGGAFVDRAQGLRVGADGAAVRVAAEAAGTLGGVPSGGRASAAVATALAGIALPLLVGHAAFGRARVGRLTLAAGAALAATVIAFQAAAARQLPAWVGAAPTLLLLAFAVRRYRAGAEGAGGR